MIASSKVQKNIFLQPQLIQEVLSKPCPAWMDELKKRRIYFVGIGTSYYAAQVAAWLWRSCVSAEAHAVHSFDFVRTPQPFRQDDIVVLFSHSGSKSFTLNAAEIAHKVGAVTVGITCQGSPWSDHLSHRLETCEREDVGVFTKSLTTALAWIVRWIGNSEVEKWITSACSQIETGPAFPLINKDSDVILLGDTVREWVAREICLKFQEAAYLRARPFGLEEFLHGPRISADHRSNVICFSTPQENRWEMIRQYLQTIEVPFLEVQAENVGLSASAGWLWQIFWGQRFTLDACQQLGVDPDTLRTHEVRYKKAREALKL
ncbi:MAG: SIS domain-containing protein [Elusimicrobia bacterium]|nr:SIS domain-containing protein [Elusimicrobiota bacterium]